MVTEFTSTAELVPVREASFMINSNGFRTGGAPHALRDFLVATGARRIVTVFHPLTPDDPPHHEVQEWQLGKLIRTRTLRVPSRPPWTFALDPMVPIWPPVVDCWFGFNALACARGLVARSAGRTAKVVYWCVDFVEQRFGPHSPLTWLYEGMDGLCCSRADMRFDVSEVAARSRSLRHRGRSLAPTRVVGLGAWLERAPFTREDSFRARKVVFVGHLVSTAGPNLLLEALGILAARSVDFTAEFIGRGPLEEELRSRARSAGLANRVRFLGYIEDHSEVEAMLAASTIGVAPYDADPHSFTRFADPAKLKTYLAAGLPILMTDVPPNASELEAAGAAEIVPFKAETLADAIQRLLASPEEWNRRRIAALKLRGRYDWGGILTGALEALGYRS